jgi:hypothetical protein
MRRGLTIDCSWQAAWRRPGAEAPRPTHSIAASGWLQIAPSEAHQSRQPPRRTAAASMKPLAAKSTNVRPTTYLCLCHALRISPILLLRAAISRTSRNPVATASSRTARKTEPRGDCDASSLPERSGVARASRYFETSPRPARGPRAYAQCC